MSPNIDRIKSELDETKEFASPIKISSIKDNKNLLVRKDRDNVLHDRDEAFYVGSFLFYRKTIFTTTF